VVDVEQRAIVATHRLAAAPRDLRWCDPTRPGPVLPEWTDGEGEAPDFGPFAPPVRKKKNPSGLVPP